MVSVRPRCLHAYDHQARTAGIAYRPSLAAGPVLSHHHDLPPQGKTILAMAMRIAYCGNYRRPASLARFTPAVLGIDAGPYAHDGDTGRSGITGCADAPGEMRQRRSGERDRSPLRPCLDAGVPRSCLALRRKRRCSGEVHDRQSGTCGPGVQGRRLSVLELRMPGRWDDGLGVGMLPTMRSVAVLSRLPSLLRKAKAVIL